MREVLKRCTRICWPAPMISILLAVGSVAYAQEAVRHGASGGASFTQGAPAPNAAQDQPGADSGSAEAAQAIESPAGGEWRFSLAPYFWLPAQSGHTTVKGITTDISLNLADAWDLIDENFDGGLLLHFEASKERLSLFADVMYLDLEHQGNGLFGTRNIGLEQGIFELGAAYALIDRPLVEGQELGLRLEPLAGARAYYLESSISFPVLIDTSGDKTWVDGFVGARARLELDRSLALFARGDLGGGGSDFAWNALGGVDVRLADWASLLAGYRALSTDYSSGEFEYDVTLYGPFIALSFRF